MNIQIETVSDIEVIPTVHGYSCAAVLKASGVSIPYPVRLMVPVSAYGAIELRYGGVDDKQVQEIFVQRIRKYVLAGGLEGLPAGTVVDLGALHGLEL